MFEGSGFHWAKLICLMEIITHRTWHKLRYWSKHHCAYLKSICKVWMHHMAMIPVDQFACWLHPLCPPASLGVRTLLNSKIDPELAVSRAPSLHSLLRRGCLWVRQTMMKEEFRLQRCYWEVTEWVVMKKESHWSTLLICYKAGPYSHESLYMQLPWGPPPMPCPHTSHEVWVLLWLLPVSSTWVMMMWTNRHLFLLLFFWPHVRWVSAHEVSMQSVRD